MLRRSAPCARMLLLLIDIKAKSFRAQGALLPRNVRISAWSYNPSIASRTPVI